MSQVLRTPDNCFSALADFTFTPHYVEVPDGAAGTLRMHYLDEGSGENGEIVLLHGQGSWCYIYRHMLAPLVDAGFRVLAPDFIGFGRSDKPADGEQHTHAHHVMWLSAFLEQVTKPGVHLYCFDWGANFALRIVTENPARFGRLIFTSAQPPPDKPVTDGWFIDWRARMFSLPKFPMGEMVAEGVRRGLSDGEIAAYDAPFPDETYKVGPRQFPMIHPVVLDGVEAQRYRDAWDAMGSWLGPTLTLFNADDKYNAERFQWQIPGAKGQPHQLYPDTSFYALEDHGPAMAAAAADFLRA